MVLLASSSASAHFCCVHVSGPWFYNALIVSHIPQVAVDARNMDPKCNEIYNLLACNKGPPMGMRMVIITTCHCLHTAHNILYLGTLSDHRYSAPADHHVHRNNIPQHLTTVLKDCILAKLRKCRLRLRPELKIPVNCLRAQKYSQLPELAN